MKSALIALAIITSSFALAQAQAPVPAPGPEQPAPGPIPAPLPGDPGPGPGPGPADGAQEALTALVHLFGQTPAGGIIRGDRQAFPQCKVFVNYLMDRGPAPGVRIGVEQWNYALIFRNSSFAATSSRRKSWAVRCSKEPFLQPVDSLCMFAIPPFMFSESVTVQSPLVLMARSAMSAAQFRSNFSDLIRSRDYRERRTTPRRRLRNRTKLFPPRDWC